MAAKNEWNCPNENYEAGGKYTPSPSTRMRREQGGAPLESSPGQALGRPAAGSLPQVGGGDCSVMSRDPAPGPNARDGGTWGPGNTHGVTCVRAWEWGATTHRLLKAV